MLPLFGDFIVINSKTSQPVVYFLCFNNKNPLYYEVKPFLYFVLDYIHIFLNRYHSLLLCFLISLFNSLSLSFWLNRRRFFFKIKWTFQKRQINTSATGILFYMSMKGK